MTYTTLIVGNKTIILSVCLFSLTNIFFHYINKNSKNNKLDKLIDKHDDIIFKIKLVQNENVKKTAAFLSLLNDNKTLFSNIKLINNQLLQLNDAVALINAKLDAVDEKNNNSCAVNV